VSWQKVESELNEVRLKDHVSPPPRLRCADLWVPLVLVSLFLATRGPSALMLVYDLMLYVGVWPISTRLTIIHCSSKSWLSIIWNMKATFDRIGGVRISVELFHSNLLA
jgi:hypothetical protein